MCTFQLLTRGVGVAAGSYMAPSFTESPFTDPPFMEPSLMEPPSWHPPVDRQTPLKNITFPQLRFAGGNNNLRWLTLFKFFLCPLR